MGLTVISQPIRTVYDIESNVVGIMAQIPFEFQRTDYSRSIIDTGGNVSFTATNDGIIENTQVTDSYYLDFIYDGYESGVYPVTQVILGAGVTTVVFEILYTAPASVDANALTGRANYTVEITIFKRDGSTELLENPIRYRPRQDGTLFVDLAGLVVGRVVINRDSQFRIQYTEIYNDTSFSSVLLDPIIGLIGRKQYLDAGGTTMWDYMANEQSRLEALTSGTSGAGPQYTLLTFAIDEVPFPWGIGDYVEVYAPPYIGTFVVKGSNSTIGSKWLSITTPYTTALTIGNGPKGQVNGLSGKFLTDFKKSKIWIGWGRTISFVLDDNLFTRTGYTDINVQAINEDRVGTELSQYNEEFTGEGIHDFQLQTTEGTAQQSVSMFWSPDIFMSKTHVFEQEDVCRNPIMIEWVNNKGGLEQHLFSVNQAVNSVVNEGLIFDQHLETTFDLASDTIGRLSYERNQKIILSAQQLTPDFARALSFIKLSPVVYVWLNQSGSEKIEIIVVDDFGFPYETNNPLVDFNVTVQLPKNFDLFQ